MKWGRGGYFPKKRNKPWGWIAFGIGMIAFAAQYWFVYSSSNPQKPRHVLSLDSNENLKRKPKNDYNQVKETKEPKAEPNINTVLSLIKLSVGDGTHVIVYRYIVRNEGKVAVENVGIPHIQEGRLKIITDETLVTPGGKSVSRVTGDSKFDGKWDVLGPGDSIQFEAVQRTQWSQYQLIGLQ